MTAKAKKPDELELKAMKAMGAMEEGDAVFGSGAEVNLDSQVSLICLLDTNNTTTSLLSEECRSATISFFLNIYQYMHTRNFQRYVDMLDSLCSQELRIILMLF